MINNLTSKSTYAEYSRCYIVNLWKVSKKNTHDVVHYQLRFQNFFNLILEYQVIHNTLRWKLLMSVVKMDSISVRDMCIYSSRNRSFLGKFPVMIFQNVSSKPLISEFSKLVFSSYSVIYPEPLDKSSSLNQSLRANVKLQMSR